MGEGRDFRGWRAFIEFHFQKVLAELLNVSGNEMGETRYREPRVRKLGCQAKRPQKVPCEQKEASEVAIRSHAGDMGETLLLRRNGCECIRWWGKEREKLRMKVEGIHDVMNFLGSIHCVVQT